MRKLIGLLGVIAFVAALALYATNSRAMSTVNDQNFGLPCLSGDFGSYVQADGGTLFLTCTGGAWRPATPVPIVAASLATDGGLKVTNGTSTDTLSVSAAAQVDGGLTVNGGTTTDTLTASSAKNKGTCVLGTSCSAIPINTGGLCTCSDTTGSFPCKPAFTRGPPDSVTFTGNGTDGLVYLCE